MGYEIKDGEVFTIIDENEAGVAGMVIKNQNNKLSHQKDMVIAFVEYKPKPFEEAIIKDQQWFILETRNQDGSMRGRTVDKRIGDKIYSATGGLKEVVDIFQVLPTNKLNNTQKSGKEYMARDKIFVMGRADLPNNWWK